MKSEMFLSRDGNRQADLRRWGGVLNLMLNPWFIAVLLIVLEVLAILPNARPFFFVLAALSVFATVANRLNGSLLIILFLVVQSSTPGFQGTELLYHMFELELGGNWFTIRVGGMALVHWVMIFLLLINFRSILFRLYRWDWMPAVERKFLIHFSVFTLIGLTTGLMFSLNLYRYLVEFQIVIYLLISFLVFPVGREYLNFGRKFLFYSLPIGGAVYIVIAAIFGDYVPSFSTRFDVIDYYVVMGLVALFLCDPKMVGLTLWEQRFAKIIPIGYVLVVFGQLGAMSYVGIVLIFFYFLLNRLRTGGHFLRPILILITSSVIFVGAGYYWVVVKADPWAIMKTNQIFELFSKIKNPEEMPQSTRVRVLEFQNIVFEGIENPVKGAFGSGFGGQFTDANFEFKSLNPTDYTRDQIEGRKFYAPHNNPNWILLKFGWYGLAMFIMFVLILWTSSISVQYSLVHQILLFLVGLGLLFMFGYGPKNSIILGMMLALTIRDLRSHRKAATGVTL